MNQERSFRVTVGKDAFVFCAAHFITLGPNECETLHGHNYRVSASLEGVLTAAKYVIDFVKLKHLIGSLVNELDHRVLLPANNPFIRLERTHNRITVHYGNREYTFPESDVYILPMENTTAELLADYICEKLGTILWDDRDLSIDAIEISVEEVVGQAGVCRLRRPS